MSIIMSVALTLAVFYASCLNSAYSDFYTGMTTMKQLIPTLNIIDSVLNNYISFQENQLHLIKKYISHVDDELEKVNENAEEYLLNPINDYILIKRLTADWNITKSLMFGDFHQELLDNITMQLESALFPTEEDLQGAAVALIRLQETYMLDTENIARGGIDGNYSRTELTCDDCFQLGKAAYDERQYNLMYLWMAETLRRFELNQNFTTVQKWKILDYLAFGSYLAGNNLKALNLTYELLALNSHHEIMLNNLTLYQELSSDEKLSEKIQDVNVEAIKSKPVLYSYRTRFRELCRRQVELPVHVSSQLRCRYVNHGNPFLLLAPLKEEEAYLNPRILLYREVLYPSEISIFKNLTSHKLKRAYVFDDKAVKSILADYRISKSGWINDMDHPIMPKIVRRLEDMTRLSMKFAEEVQVNNYGIGGHYESHYDHNIGINTGVNEHEDRIATFIFYMNSVKKGGATVFPVLDLALWPEEGSAAFWHNLHTSGKGDNRTLHGACPVLEGSKWVATKWIHTTGQEFLRPCDTSEMW